MNRTRAVVIYLLVLTLMGSIPILLTVPIPEDSKDFLNVVLGWFIAKGGDAVGYLLNSTEGSAQKTDALVRATRRQTAPAAGTATITTAPDVDVELRRPDDGGDPFAMPLRPE